MTRFLIELNDPNTELNEEDSMSRRRYTAEAIIAKLREAEVEHARGQTVAQLCKKIGVSEQTYYRWPS